jgi:hypothetical protein
MDSIQEAMQESVDLVRKLRKEVDDARKAIDKAKDHYKEVRLANSKRITYLEKGLVYLNAGTGGGNHLPARRSGSGRADKEVPGFDFTVQTGSITDQLIDWFGKKTREFTVTEIVEGTGIPRIKLSSSINKLKDHGYLEHTGVATYRRVK